MARKANSQLNIRSDVAKARATELARETGRSVTQVVEEAVSAYRAEPVELATPRRTWLERRGRILTLCSDGAHVTLAETNAAIDQDRTRGS